ncbi:general stress protein [Promicromonospora panici]|uniref:general stress protein n=1 Tax=Promicromonospora panici TaxID=2219658 RepID=UPI00101C7ECC|nr:general stress protein [Promicromonospora panici]
MSMSRPGAVPKVPTLPAGDEVAAYSTYLEAQKAVDYLSDNKFPVENVTIVGTDLRMVERVTGRLTYGRVALAGALSGAWFGFFVGLLITLFAGEAGFQVMFAGIALGAGFGLLFSILSYTFTGGRRDFTSSSQIVAATYAILCGHEHASDARALLMRSPSGLGKSRGAATVGVPAPVAPPTVPGQPPVAGPPAPAAPPASRPTDPRWVTPTGEPRYGAMRPGSGAGSADGGAAGAGSAGAAGDAGGTAGAGAAPAGPPSDAPADAPTNAPSNGASDAPSQTEPPTPPDQASAAANGQREDESADQDDVPTQRTTPRRTNPYAPPSDDQK